MSSPSPSIGQVLGHYRVLEQIGAGGMGIVFRAHDLQLDRDVALKVLPAGTLAESSARARFHKEARALARLNHPNIATVHEFGSEAGIDYLVTEYIPGLTLNEKLLGGALPEPMALGLGTQLAQALEAAHERGVVHRDLKPGNLRLTPKGQLKVLDFGLAKIVRAVEPGAATESLTQDPVVSGTLPYMSPEQVRGQEVDERSDIWAAGAVLYEMSTGQRPFPERRPAQLIEDILRQEPRSPTAINPRISPGLEAVIRKALDKDPERRYQSARELRVDLNRLMPSGTGMEPAAMQAGRGRARRSRLLVAIAIGLAAVLALAGWRLRRSSHLAPHSPRILAILPFRTLNGNSAADALGTGMTETLTAKLAQLSDRSSLQLVSTREIEAQGVRSAAQAHRDFGVDLVLEGSLQQAGPLMRVNCSLVDAATHRQLGARSIDATADDIFALEDRVVTAALDILAVQVPPDRRGRVHIEAETKPEAYQHYLRGLGYLQEYQKPENIQSAIAEFGQALQADPNYARGYAALGEAYWFEFQASYRTNDLIDKAAGNCRKALALHSNISEAHICMGDVYNARGEYQGAAEEFKRAVELDPTRETALRGLADAYEKLGKLPEAEATYREAINLRPQYWAAYNVLGAFFSRQARYSDAEGMFERAIQLAPENFRGYENLGGIYALEGKNAKAIEVLQRSIAIRPTLEAYTNLGAAYFALRKFPEAAATFQQGLRLDDRDPLIWGNLGDALYWTPEKRDTAPAAYRKAISLATAALRINPRDATQLAFLATYYAMVGEKATALDTLNKALQLDAGDAEVNFRAAIVYNRFADTEHCLASLEKAVGAGYSPSAILDTPDFDHLRNNPRLRKLVRAR